MLEKGGGCFEEEGKRVREGGRRGKGRDGEDATLVVRRECGELIKRRGGN